MSLTFGRGQGNAEILIDEEKCTACGLCVSVCKGFPLSIIDGKLRVDQNHLFGCIGCGQCMAICPQDAIKIDGRDISFADTFLLPPARERAQFGEFRKLLESRRSVREFKDKEIEPDIIQNILQAAATSPMGIPPSEVGVVVCSGRPKVSEFKESLLAFMQRAAPFFSPFMLTLMRPFMSNEDYLSMKQFVGPVIKFFLEDSKTGRDWFLYNAPLAMCFYATPFADPADVYVAATHAMLAGNALGLGTCMLGFPMFMVQYSKKIREQFHFPAKIRGGLVVIFGYSTVNFHRGIRRRFANVEILR